MTGLTMVLEHFEDLVPVNVEAVHLGAHKR